MVRTSGATQSAPVPAASSSKPIERWRAGRYSAGASGINQWPPIPNPRDHRNLLRKREAFLSKDEDVEQVKLLIGLDKALRLALFQCVVSHAVAASFS